MSVEQTQRILNQLDKELVALEKKLADELKKEADKSKRINDVQRSIPKNTSPSTVQSKLRQIQGYQSEFVKINNNKADINKKIADKRKKRTDVVIKLQREEAEEAKRAAREQKRIYDAYERRIAELNTQAAQPAIPKSVERTNLYQQAHIGEEYDVFISHASEDKESFADALCKELQEAEIKVWYDTLSIAWGDSLRAKIDNGLKKSKYGIVIISRDYIKKGWTQYELDGLFQREMTGGKTILPIWHNITKQEVEEFSHTLAGRKALNSSSMTPAEIANELRMILGINDRNQGGQENA